MFTCKVIKKYITFEIIYADNILIIKNENLNYSRSHL
jgi:hypothetical protein